MSVNTSIFTLIAIAMDRYTAIIHPLKKKSSKKGTKVTKEEEEMRRRMCIRSYTTHTFLQGLFCSRDVHFFRMGGPDRIRSERGGKMAKVENMPKMLLIVKKLKSYRTIKRSKVIKTYMCTCEQKCLFVIKP